MLARSSCVSAARNLYFNQHANWFNWHLQSCFFVPAGYRVSLARVKVQKARKRAQGVFTYNMELTNKCS